MTNLTNAFMLFNSKNKFWKNCWSKCNQSAAVGFWLKNKCPQFDSRTRRDHPPKFDFLQFPTLWDKRTYLAWLLPHSVQCWLLTNMAELSLNAITSQSTLFHRTRVVGSYHLLLMNLRVLLFLTFLVLLPMFKHINGVKINLFHCYFRYYLSINTYSNFTFCYTRIPFSKA